MPIAEGNDFPELKYSAEIRPTGSVVMLRSLNKDAAERISWSLEYIGDMCCELANIAGQNQSARLAHLLREAAEEAREQCRYLTNNHRALQNHICGD